MAKKPPRLPKLWIARDKGHQRSYVFMAGARKRLRLSKGSGLWVADSPAICRDALCPKDWEKACPWLILKPGTIRELAPPEWAEKAKKRRAKR